MLREGKVVETLMILVFLGVALYYLMRAIRGRVQEYRRLPMLDSISEGIDRAVETGRPLFMTMGAYAYLSGLFAAMTLSAVNIMRYTYRLAVRKGATPMFMLPINPEVAPLIDGVYRESAVAEGKPEAYKRENIYYFGNDEPAYRSGLLNLLAAHRPATYVVAGAITGTGDMNTTVAARSVGALVVGGQARITHQGEVGPLSFDYYAACADIYAAGAILSGDQVVMSSLIAADLLTYIAIALTIIGVVLGLGGLPFVSWIKI